MEHTPLDTTPTCSLEPRLQHGIKLLLQSYHYATMLERDLWDFPVDIQDLLSAGWTRNDVRYLTYCELVTFKSRSQLHCSDECCVNGRLLAVDELAFVLTEKGVAIAQQFSVGMAENNSVSGPEHLLASVDSSMAPASMAPKWDIDRQELRCEGRLVKQFKLPSPNQETVLMAFEEEHWPPRIDDPLPPNPDMDPKRRLNDTIKSLNKNQKYRAIRFMGDGSGRGIRWEPFHSA